MNNKKTLLAGFGRMGRVHARCINSFGGILTHVVDPNI